LKGNHGAHGAFDHQARETSLELQASLGRRWIGASVAVIAAAVLLASRQ